MKFTKNRLLSLLLVLAMMLALVPTVFAAATTSLTMSKPSTTLAVDGTETLTVTKNPSDGEGTIVWESSDSTKVSVDGGVLTAHSVTAESSPVTITAKVSGSNPEVTATCAVTVTKATVAAPSGLTVLTKSASTQAEVKSLLDQKYTDATITNKDKLSRGVWTLTNSSFNADVDDSTYSSTKDDTMYFRATLTVASGYTDGYEIAANTYITATVTFQPAPTAEIKTQPAAPATCMVGDQNKKLSVTAEGKKADGVSADVSLNYQWYCATTSTGTGTPVATDKGGKTSECTIDTATAGTYYYYCVVTASQNGV